MKKVMFLNVLLAVFVLVFIGQTVYSQSFPDGTAIRRSTGSIYLIDGGKRRHIPDPPTVAALGLQGHIRQDIPDSQIDAIPLGAPLPRLESKFIRCDDTGAIYILEKGKRRHIPNPTTLVRKFPGADIKNIPCADADAIPLGDQIPSVDPFPLQFRQDDNFGSHHMISEVTISKNGRVDIITETNNHIALKGNCGRVAIWLLDKDGNRLTGPQGGHRYCVGAKVPFGKSVRKDTWDFTISPDILRQVAGIGILQTDDSRNPLDIIKENVEKVQQILKACPDCVKAGAAAVGR